MRLPVTVEIVQLGVILYMNDEPVASADQPGAANRAYYQIM